MNQSLEGRRDGLISKTERCACVDTLSLQLVEDVAVFFLELYVAACCVDEPIKIRGLVPHRKLMRGL